MAEEVQRYTYISEMAKKKFSLLCKKDFKLSKCLVLLFLSCSVCIIFFKQS